MNRRKILPAILLSFLLIGTLFWLSQTTKTTDKESHAHDHEHDHDEDELVKLTDEQIRSLEIPVRQAAPGNLNQALSTRGRIILHPDKLAHILPKTSGIAQNIRKNIGDSVEEGEVLATIESREMADIKAAYLASVEKQKLAQSLFDRETALQEKKVSAKQDYISAESAYVEARIEVELNKQKLQAFGFSNEEISSLSHTQGAELRLYEIRSPIKGTVISRHMTKGEFLESTETVFEIADLSKVWVEIGIYPKDLQKILKGQTVKVLLPIEGLSSQAKIIYVSPIIEEETINAKAVAELDNPAGKWKPGSFVKVSIATETIPASVVISKEAVQQMDGADVVFVKVPEGFEKRIVETGTRDDSNVEIVSGLKAGESYADGKTFLLKADLKKSTAEHEH